MRSALKNAASRIWPGARLERSRLHDAEDAAVATRASVARLAEDVASLRTVLDELATRTHDDRLDTLRALVAKVEPYQPLYGVAGIIDQPARSSSDRALAIAAALGNLRGQRVLDIGSSLGYMSFYLADRGCFVHGWDFNADNVEVAHQVGRINGVPATFTTKELTLESIRTIEAGEFDTVLVLAVFHHIIHFQGLEAAQRLVQALLERAPVLVVELARRGEDAELFWDAAQPSDPMELFDLVKDYVEIEKLGTFGTHLSIHDRPVYKVSLTKAIAVGPRSYAYDYSTHEAYAGSPAAQGPWRRRYYFAADHIVKEYVFTADAPDNWAQILNELHVYSILKDRDVYHSSTLLDYELDENHAKLAVARIRGELFGDAGPVEAEIVHTVAVDVLRTLESLRTLGLHHNDVRSWNILVHDEGGWLIDYGRTGGFALEDDVVALVWALAAALEGQREPYLEDKLELPAAEIFENTGLLGLYQAVANGERELAALRIAAQRPPGARPIAG